MPPPPRRLLVVTPTFHPEPIGTPLYATDLCRWFSTSGWSVHVVTAQPFYPQFERYDGYGRQTRHDVVDRLRLTRLPTVVPRKGGTTWRAASDLNFLVQGLLRASRVPRPDAVLSISPGTPWVTVVGASIARNTAPHISLVHDIQSGLAAATHSKNGLLHAVLAQSERRSLGTADSVLALTPRMVGALRTIGVAKPTQVLPLWSTIDPPSNFPPLEQEVQYSGNFGEKQAVSELPVLASSLRQMGIPLRVRGAGPKFQDLLPQLRAVTDGQIHAEGLVPEGELTQALSMSPIHVVLQAPGTGSYVMPSKILNALVCGATVVAMADDDSAVADLARHQPGLHIVPTGNVKLMATKVKALMPTALAPATRAHISSTAAQTFSREVVLRDLVGLLDQLTPTCGRSLQASERCWDGNVRP